MREIAPFVVLACACGAAMRQPAPASSPPPKVETPPADTAETAESKAAFDALAAKAASLAPGMREVTRHEGGLEAVDLVKADARDACVRVAFSATQPVTARLLDGEGRVLAASETASTEGALGARGPVCIRKGDLVRALPDGAGGRVRWVVWEAP